MVSLITQRYQGVLVVFDFSEKFWHMADA